MQLKGYIFSVLGHFCYLLRLGGCGSQGFTIVLRGGRFPLVSLEEGLRSGSGGWQGCFPLETEGKGEGGGEAGGGIRGGWGGERQRNRQVNAQALSKLPLREKAHKLKKSPGHRPGVFGTPGGTNRGLPAGVQGISFDSPPPFKILTDMKHIFELFSVLLPVRARQEIGDHPHPQ